MQRNKELFDKIADVIENDPDVYDQQTWLSLPESPLSYDMGGKIVEDPYNCGGSACIAGWAVMLAGVAVPYNDQFSPLAGPLLGLDEWERATLFDETWLPPDYSDYDLPDIQAKKVAEALRAIGRGESVDDNTHDDSSRWGE